VAFARARTLGDGGAASFPIRRVARSYADQLARRFRTLDAHGEVSIYALSAGVYTSASGAAAEIAGTVGRAPAKA